MNLLPASVLKEFPEGWEGRAARRNYGKMSVGVPSPRDILVPKLRRNEPRDRAHADWAKQLGIT